MYMEFIVLYNNYYINLTNICAFVQKDSKQGTSMVALDANFGLVHKTSAAKYTAASKHGNRYFLSFEEVHKEVDDKNKKQQPPNEKSVCTI
jgi:hypothetical protein